MTEEKQVQALVKFLRVSPKKLIEVTRLIQGKSVPEAIEILEFIPRKTAKLAAMGLKSAIANAENNHDMFGGNLIVHRALVEKGPAFKRFRPSARGMAHPYKKHTSHLRIILTEK